MTIYKNYSKHAMKEENYQCGTKENVSRSGRIK